MNIEPSFQETNNILQNILSRVKAYALYVVNLDGYITYFGMGAEVMFGWGKNEILTKHISALHIKEDIPVRLPLILEQEEIDKNIRENLDVVDGCADRFRKVTGQIFKFTKNVPCKSENLNINEVIESAFTLLAYHKMPSVAINIEKDLAQGLPLVKGDFNQLQEAFLDLFLNAYQAMSRGGKLTIMTANFGNHHIEIRINYMGYEISEEYSKKTFTPLLPTKKECTGLDLLICYNIINNLNGSLDIESQGNQGTTFIIRLPLVSP